MTDAEFVFVLYVPQSFKGEGKLRIAHCIGITENPEIESICFLGYYC